LISIVSAAVIWAAISLCQMREPAYGKHLLSEWLDAYDTNLRFADEVPTRSGFTDEQIDEALNDIGENAFPQLLRWLQARDSPLKLKINSLLGGQPWIRFRFEAAIARQCLAETGFIYYGPSAKAARPTLIQMTLSKDPNERDLGYEGFFFTRPEAHDFLPVAYRALEEPDPDTRAMAAQWTVERFPEEAEGLGLRSRFPQFYSLPDEQALE
jgi:hypothetical protein